MILQLVTKDNLFKEGAYGPILVRYLPISPFFGNYLVTLIFPCFASILITPQAFVPRSPNSNPARVSAIPATVIQVTVSFRTRTEVPTVITGTR